MRTLGVEPRHLATGLAVAVLPVLGLAVTDWWRMYLYYTRQTYALTVWSVTLLIVALVVAGEFVVLRFVQGGRYRRRGWLVTGAVAAAFFLVWFVVRWHVWFTDLTTLLTCLPTALLAVFVYRRIERNRRVPWPLVLLAVLWGAFVATGYAATSTNVPVQLIEPSVTPPRGFDFVGDVAPAVNEEAVKAVGVLVLLLVFRGRLASLLGGLVTGALVGTGFQLSEAALYMSYSPDNLLYQYWTRQYVELLSSHATYTGLTGAAIGLAFQHRGVLWKALCPAGGYLAAVGAHAVWNVAGDNDLFWRPKGVALTLFAAAPANAAMFDGPFLVLFVLLAVFGQRFELSGLASELRNEERVGLGTIRPDEVALLGSAKARRRYRARVLVWEGLARYLWVRRLQAAQVELAYARWHRARGEPVPSRSTEQLLRERVWSIRRAAPPPRQQRPRAVPAPALGTAPAPPAPMAALPSATGMVYQVRPAARRGANA